MRLNLKVSFAEKDEAKKLNDIFNRTGDRPRLPKPCRSRSRRLAASVGQSAGAHALPGAHIVSREMLAFEWLRQAGTD